MAWTPTPQTSPSYGYGILDEAPNVPSTPGIADYLQNYHAMNEQFRIKPLDYNKYAWQPKVDGQGPVIDNVLGQLGGGMVADDSNRDTNEDWMYDVQREPMEGSSFDGILGDFSGGGDIMTGDTTGHQLLSGVGSTARNIGKGAGLMSLFGVPGVGLGTEAAAGLSEMGDLNKRLEMAGAGNIGLFDAILAGLNPFEDLRDVAAQRLNEEMDNQGWQSLPVQPGTTSTPSTPFAGQPIQAADLMAQLQRQQDDNSQPQGNQGGGGGFGGQRGDVNRANTGGW